MCGGQINLSKRLKFAEDDEQLFTSSDEAFLYLVLENSYDRWKDISDKMNTGEYSKPRRKGYQLHSDVRTVYTDVGSGGSCDNTREVSVADNEADRDGAQTGQRVNGSWDRGMAPRSGPIKGWSRDALRRYNTIFKMVKLDRQTHKKQFRGWIMAKRNQINAKPKTKVHYDDHEKVVVETDLWDTLGVLGGDDDMGEVSHNKTAAPIAGGRRMEDRAVVGHSDINPVFQDSDDEQGEDELTGV
jgi:hypothetical protein